ncbi:MAG: GNAT family N-acetyltransferase [Acidobacteriota bacterium]
MQNYPMDVLLRDGSVLRMRPLQPGDRDALIRLFNRCSPETKRFRFLRMITSLPDSMLDQLVAVDGRDNVALVVLQGKDEGEEIVAVGRYHQMPDRLEVAEVSFLVEDAMQRRGIGTVLLDTLAEIGRENGIHYFSADVLADNRTMLSVFRKAGYAITSGISYGVTHLEFPISRSEVAETRRERQEAQAERNSLQSVMAPRTIAVVGASRNPGSVGGSLFRNLLHWGFTGTIYPVNPTARSIAGVRSYANLGELPEVPELVFIVIPVGQVLDIARECAALGVRALCVITAGFAEVGNNGVALEEELLSICRSTGMRLVGPNCMGLVNSAGATRMLGTFARVDPPAGNVAMSSQSGALGIALMEQAAQLGLGVSSFISIGNRADVSSNDLLLFWESDEATDVILLYMESFGNPRRFARTARMVSRAKPIVAVKAGRSTVGAEAASSHTASLAGSDQAADALFAQTGIIRVDTLDDFFSVARLLASQPIPRGKRVAVLTNGGGPGIIAVDAAVAAGLDIPALSEATQARLREVLPPHAAVRNPVDTIAGAGPETYRACLEILCDDPDLDALVVIFIPPLATPTREVAQVLAEVMAARPSLDKTVVAVFFDPATSMLSVPVSASSDVPVRPRKVPVYTFPEAAVTSLARAVRYGTWRSKRIGRQIDQPVDLARAREIVAAYPQGGWLAPDDVVSLLAGASIGVTRPRLATSAAEAARIAREIGHPLALKIADPPVLHKSDVDGIILNVSPDETGAVEVAWERLTRQVAAHGIELKGASLMPMARPGVEVLAGMTVDPVFGPLVAFGTGGYYVELIRDVAFRVLPMTDQDVSEMIASTRASQLLKGYRGSPEADLKAVEELLLRLGALVEKVPEIAEIDLNPVIVHPRGEGLTMIDARVRLVAR